LTIVRPANGAVLGKNGQVVDVDVTFKSGRSLASRFNVWSKVELLMDNKVVATVSGKPSGKATFSLDVGGYANGLHKLLARGTVRPRLLGKLRGRTVVSQAVSVTIDQLLPTKAPAPISPIGDGPVLPTKAPAPMAPIGGDPAMTKAPIRNILPDVFPTKVPAATSAPTKAPITPTNPCDPRNSFLYFPGHDEASSVSLGTVNVTWSPAFTFGIELVDFLWCGNFSYDVFYTEGVFNFSSLNVTGPELIELGRANDKGINHVETQHLSIVLRNLEPGSTYRILVTAKTGIGHFSFNRDEAQVRVSTTAPVLKSNFTRMVTLQETNSSFQVNNMKSNKTVVFSGDLPLEVITLQPLDFVYFFDSDGNATMVQLRNNTKVTAWETAWTYQPKDLSDVFDELDLSVEVVNLRSTNDEDFVDPEIDDLLGEAEFEALDINVKVHLCLVAFPGEARCSETSEDRRRLFGGFLRKVRKRLRKIASAIEKAVKSAWNVLFGGVTVSKEVKIFDIDKSATFNISDSLQIGMKFDVSARSRFSITVSVIRLIHRGSAELYGGYGLEGYISLPKQQLVTKRYKPDPIILFQASYKFWIVVGPVPVLITNRPSIQAHLEASTTVEGQALVVGSYGYDYHYEFSFDRFRSNKFQRTTKLTRRPDNSPDPEFNLRLNSVAEFGVTLAWDLLVYDILQASMALDLGLKSELDVGTTVEAMVVTNPYFYTLNKFEAELFIRLRLFLGLNTDIRRLLRSITKSPVDFLVSFRSSLYRIPALQLAESILPVALQKGIDKARAHPVYGEATSLSIAELNALERDPFTNGNASVTGIDRDFGRTWTVFSAEVTLFQLPSITFRLAPDSTQICEGSDAVTLQVLTTVNGGGLDALGRWFANFDGKLFKEDTDWSIKSDRTKIDSLTVNLPRSAISGSGFKFYETPTNASLILRATPKIAPLPKLNLFAKVQLKSFVRLANFECCDDSDCVLLYNNSSAVKAVCGGNKMCTTISTDRFRARPNTILVNRSSLVTLTVNLTGLDATGINEFRVYRFDPLSLLPGDSPIVSLRDDGSGKGDDSVARDFVFSNTLALRSDRVNERFGFQAVPVIGQALSFASPLKVTTADAVRSILGTSMENPITRLLTAESVEGLVLVVEYSWPADKNDLDTGTFFLGSSVGYGCDGESPYMSFTGDDTGLGGKETVTVALGQSFKETQWANETSVVLNAGWFQPPHRGPASIAISIRYDFTNGTRLDGGLVSFVVDPGVQSGCSSTEVAVARISSSGSRGRVTIQITSPY
jgi:hypothetical protein